MEYTTRIMKIGDIEGAVDIHFQAFPGFFLTFLGQGFLRELYRGIITDPTGIAYVSTSQQGVLAGFVAGTTTPAGLYKRLIQKRLFHFGIAALPAALKKPSVIPRLFRALSAPQEHGKEEACGTLMSIAVSPTLQGYGIGKKLVAAFLNEASQRGLRQVNLTTDRLDNDATNRFYQSLGFHLHTDYVTPEGRQMNEYRINLTSEP